MSPYEGSIEKKFELIFEQVSVGMIFCDLHGMVMEVNRHFAQMLGYETQHFHSTERASVTHPDDIGKDSKDCRRIISGSINSFNTEKRYLHKDGRFVWTEASVSGIRDASGVICQLFMIIKDISH